MANNRIFIRDVLCDFIPERGLRAALLLTYCFDGKWLEAGFISDLFERPVSTALVVRGRNAIMSEASKGR